MSEVQETPGGELVVYRTEDGRNRISVRFEGETVWLTQAMMADLYETSVPNINMHIRNVLDEGELSAEATIKEYLIVRQEGQRADYGKQILATLSQELTQDYGNGFSYVFHHSSLRRWGE